MSRPDAKKVMLGVLGGTVIFLLSGCAEKPGYKPAAPVNVRAESADNKRSDARDLLSALEFPQGSKSEALDRVWSGHRVGFDFVGKGHHQVVAYFDDGRQMSVAHRASPTGGWRMHKLPSFLGWDSHNYVTAAIDKAGHFHVTGNLHGDRLVYFRTTESYDVRSLKRVDVMVLPEKEASVTSPYFMTGKDGTLYFKFRDGGSGDGVEIYYVFDTGTRSWSRLHEGPLVDGEGERNGYFVGPSLGSDGYFHLAWVWRETPNASTNHDISYARSLDLLNWERSDGAPYQLPIMLDSAEIVAPVQVEQGLLNGHTPIGFDAASRPVVTYQRYDDGGNSQLYVARRESDGWRSVKVSAWKDSRQDLARLGALPITLVVKEPVFIAGNGDLVARAMLEGTYYEYRLDPESLAVKSESEYEPFPSSLYSDDIANEIPLLVRPLRLSDGSRSSEYFLTWEALPPNQDKARNSITPPSTLRVRYVPVE